MSGAVIRYPHVTIEGNIYAAIPNPKKGESGLDLYNDYVKETGGAYRVLSTTEKTLRLAAISLKNMGSAMAGFLDEVAGKLGFGSAVLVFTRLTSTAQKAKEAVCDQSKGLQGPAASKTRAVWQKMHDVVDGIATWCYAGSILIGNAIFKKVADVFDLVSNVTDLKMASEDWSLAKKHLSHVQDHPSVTTDPKGLLKERFGDKMTESFWKAVKAAASIFVGVVGLMVLSFGGPVLSPTLLIGVGLTGSIAAMAAHFFKETRELKMVDFYKPCQVHRSTGQHIY